ncbi:MAG: shikimate kinase [Firmicutes bacterium HGW-Firmicutes-11]|nr:MAG: shikimate kinase [Firmicutes bacterium HGW-Firmicutes-11]
MNNLVLIGMPGCGKSTVGVILAKTLGMKFIDVDLLIQEREGILLQELIDTKGMELFLKAEEAAMLSIEGRHTVIATGGSAVYSEPAMIHLKSQGMILYLKLSLDSIKKRLHNIHSRGIAMGPGESLDDLFARRVGLYESYAEQMIDCEGKNVEEIVESIIRLTGRSTPPHCEESSR